MSTSTRAPRQPGDDEKGRPSGRPFSNAGDVQRSTVSSENEFPKVAAGVELIGEYEGSGFKDPHFIARRADGQVIQLSELLYLVAQAADGSSDLSKIAEAVSDQYEKSVSADNVEYLIEKKLRPLGVIANADGSSPKVQKVDPMLALKFRFKLVPERAVGPITSLFKPLFWPPVIALVLILMAALDYWLFLVHGVAQSIRGVVYQPALLLLIFGLVVVSAAFHEIGHATACAYGGAKPGAIGAGLYLVWPAFYTDVTDAYRLGKGGRLRTDLGGVYFNLIFSLATGAAYFATGHEALLLLIVIQHLEIAHQFLPFLRLDGYYIISDLTGVPDMFARLKPILASLIPWKKTHKSVKELKPWVRLCVSAWVLITVPFVLFNLGMIMLHLPRIFATAWDSFYVHSDKMNAAFARGDAVAGSASVIQLVALTLPSAGIALGFGRLGRRVGSAVWGWSAGKPLARSAALLTGATILGGVAYIWVPNGEYVPIQPEEKGTLTEAVASFQYVTDGRPALPPEREKGLGDIRYESSETANLLTRDAPVPDPSPSPSGTPDPSPSPTTDMVEESPTSDPSPSPTPTTSPM